MTIIDKPKKIPSVNILLNNRSVQTLVSMHGLVLVTRCVQSVLINVRKSVLAGEPVIILAKSKSSKILGWVPESLPGETFNELDFQIDLVAMERIPIQYVEAGPAFEELPQVLWSAPGVPEYGQPVLFRAPVEAPLIPGQKVEISAIL